MSFFTKLPADWFERHQPTAAEIREIWQIVDRDLADAASDSISPDWQYGIAYNAALKLITILFCAEGYRPTKDAMTHARTLDALPEILGAHRKGDADYLETCRHKRQAVEFDNAGSASRKDAEQLIAFGQKLRGEVLAWLKQKHPTLAPK